MKYLKEKLKKNEFLRKVVKAIKIMKEFAYDSFHYISNYNENKTLGSYEYDVLILTHSLEKGLTSSNIRPFGYEKVIDLIVILQDNKLDLNSEIFHMGLSILENWASIISTLNHDTKYNALLKKVNVLVELNGPNSVKTGTYSFHKDSSLDHRNNLEEIIKKRRSVRKYSDEIVNVDEVKKCVDIANSYPSACNRQMVKCYFVDKSKSTQLIESTLLGLSGFEQANTNFMIITNDSSSFTFFGERNQGNFNAGLFSMQLVQVLSSYGYGTCFIQWCNSYKDELAIKKEYGIPKNERISTFIGFGHALESLDIPHSHKLTSDSNFIEV